MSAAETPESIYVVPVARVAQSVDFLLNRNIHVWFIAYLHLRRQASLQGTTVGVRPDWAELSETMFVPGGPPKKPHLRPFWSGTHGAGQEWLNANLAGSYAPSSIRNVAFKVLDVDSQRRFVFKEGHPVLALENFLNGQRVPVLPLASYLFRDRGIITPAASDTDLVRVFRREYGYRDRDEEEFHTLYDDQWDDDGPGTWLEPWFEPYSEPDVVPVEELQ